jgi:hypothetical protein
MLEFSHKVELVFDFQDYTLVDIVDENHASSGS